MAKKDQYWRRPSLQRMRFVDQVGGSVQGLALRSNLLALTTDTLVTFYDVTDPRAPALLGATEPLIDDPNVDDLDGVALGETCAVVSIDGGFCLLDIRDPRCPTAIPRDDNVDGHRYRPSVAAGPGALYIGAYRGIVVCDERLRRVAAPRWARNYRSASLASDGQFLYVLAEAALHVLEIAGSRRPRVLGSCPAPDSDYVRCELAAGDGRVAVSTKDGLAVIDCREPLKPRPGGTLRLLDGPLALAARGSHVYAMLGGGYGMYIISVADPDRPHVVAHIGGLGHTEQVVATPTHVFLLDGDEHRRRHTKRLDAHYEDPVPPQPLRLVDVSEPVRPVAVPLATSFQHAQALAVAGDTLYVADHRNAYAGLRVIALREPARPHGWAPLWERPVAVQARDTLAVVATLFGVQTFDCSDPQKPRRLGGLALDGQRVRAMDVDAAGRRAYILTNDHLHVIGLARSQQPQELDLVPCAPPGRAILVTDRHAYLADGAGVTRVRLGRGHIASRDTLTLMGPVRQLVRIGNLLCAATRRGVEFVRLDDERATGSFESWKDPMEIHPYAMAAVGDSHLFCVRGVEMLLLDVRDPSAVKVVDHWSTIEEKWWVGGAAASGNRIYVAAKRLDVLVLEHGLPESPGPTGIAGA